ncbi:MAG TPA: aminotransferase class V-fold PLP-dependent enzyme, partial [Sphingomonadales bacterium]|nr:aminotransferase class V-fold PLP-dependent enzyme [Sphingomonadales bacterium]
KSSKIKMLRDDLEAGILAICPAAKVFGAGAERLPNTLSLMMPGVRAETQVMAFDLEGICVSSGAACSSGKVRTSHVLSAMEIGRNEVDCVIRVSLGWTTTEADINHFIAVWEGLYERTHKLLGQKHREKA